MVAEGAIAAGCRFFAGYPITPASGIYKSMIEFLQQQGDLAVSSPDEISALAYCVGASLRGFKAMTATSGPGWALMIETVQYALMTETPVVIALVQRLGPSTGGATQGAQGDILLAEFCTSGGYTIPIYSPSTPRECFELTIQSFNCAEMLRTPVVLLLDKEVGMTTESVDYAQLRSPQIVNRTRVENRNGNKTADRRMYEFENRSDIPAFAAVGDSAKVTATGSAHNKSGALKKNDSETLEVLYHLEEKIRARAREITTVAVDHQADASTLVISYGVTARTMKEAVKTARSNGKRVSSMNVKTLFPVPEKEILKTCEGISRIVIPEENMHGQYRLLIERLFGTKEVIGINKIGSMITPKEIIDRII